jgi:hypothetical protein
MMTVKPLALKDARRVADLEKELFPENQRVGILRIKVIILKNRRFQCETALGLFDESRLVGYLLAYPLGFKKKALSKHEKIGYISDFAVLPAYRQHMGQLLESLTLNGRKIFPGRPVIIDAFEYYKDKWLKHAALIRVLGYDIVRCDRFRHPRFDEDLFRIRLEPVDTAVHTVKDRYAIRITPHIVYYLFKAYSLVRKKFRPDE